MVVLLDLIQLCREDVSTLRPRQNDRHLADDTFKHIFLNGNVRNSNEISLKLVPEGPINNIPALDRIMTWSRPGDKPLSEPKMVTKIAKFMGPTWGPPKGLSPSDGPHVGPMNLAIRVDYRRVYSSLGRNKLKLDWNGNPATFMTNNFRIRLSPSGLPGIKQITWKHWSLSTIPPSECFITHAIKEMADATLTNKCGCEIFFILIHCVIQLHSR